MERYISFWFGQQSASQQSGEQAKVQSALICPHCREPHGEEHLCPQLLFVHGLPSKLARSSRTSRRSRRSLANKQMKVGARRISGEAAAGIEPGPDRAR